jgi:hypothetical protein
MGPRSDTCLRMWGASIEKRTFRLGVHVMLYGRW